MDDSHSRERIGSALQALAADLVTERRRVLLLRRENRALRAELAELRGHARGPDDEESEAQSDVYLADVMEQASGG